MCLKTNRQNERDAVTAVVFAVGANVLAASVIVKPNAPLLILLFISENCGQLWPEVHGFFSSS